MNLSEKGLLPCPFCGNADKPSVFRFEGEPYVPGFEVRCDASGWDGQDGKGCGSASGWSETTAEAIAAWNRRAYLQAAGSEEWRPIETAPKTGEEVILGGRGWANAGFWNDGSKCHRADAGWFFEDDRANLLIAKNAHPTHWRPLPSPPQEPRHD